MYIHEIYEVTLYVDYLIFKTNIFVFLSVDMFLQRLFSTYYVGTTEGMFNLSECVHRCIQYCVQFYTIYRY